jgi:hypothetical protein
MFLHICVPEGQHQWKQVLINSEVQVLLFYNKLQYSCFYIGFADAINNLHTETSYAGQIVVSSSPPLQIRLILRSQLR